MDSKRAAEIRNLNTNVRDDLNLEVPNLLILVCAVMVACVGLNMDSTPIVIGAMLISPMMGPIVGIGYGTGIGDSKLIATAIRLFLAEVGIVIVAASLYFWVSPLKELNDQLLARTEPTLWDVIVAFFGGIAGIIGASKKDGGNVVPGVAIATTLLPPLCTIGFGISQFNSRYIIGAGYLFLINIFFIIVASVIGTLFFRARGGQSVDFPIKHRVTIMVVAVIIAVPSFISASRIVKQTFVEAQLSEFIDKELDDEYVIDQSVSNKKVNLELISSHLNKQDISRLKAKLSDYNLDGYELNIDQMSRGNYITVKEFKQFMKGTNASEVPITNNGDEDKLQDIQSKIEAKYKSAIDLSLIGKLGDGSGDAKNALLIQLKTPTKSQTDGIKAAALAMAEKDDINLRVYFATKKSG
ncbi:TIGR00341 family protein [Lentilactobacillus sp. Marseille-Q4993]|uniref:TIGR00341 family protein n=1 Tax=Lentilactobacillus sp. Marseille-Q4993 TaxID=3039492 RepID=UPI0024BC9712|nr:TIGR00341 family protein [Lentilactobacillus sp. Marseille-Q4993]